MTPDLRLSEKQMVGKSEKPALDFNGSGTWTQERLGFQYQVVGVSTKQRTFSRDWRRWPGGESRAGKAWAIPWGQEG